jgi:conjugative relaxase-like TrwC/TraI family protein
MSVRISPSKATAAQVKNYFIHAPSQEAYYCEGQDFNGIYGGKGAARLGLSGSLQEGTFSRLCDNLHPLTGEKLTLRMKEERRVGYDVNFHVPKSVSLAYFYSKDDRILQRARQCAYETMLDMQDQAAARVRKGGQKDGDRTTGELTWAEFPHMTARPVEGVPDPHLHIHCYVFNVTYDLAENAFKALQFGRVMEEADSYEKAFHARLATSLKEIGLEIEPNEYAFEIRGVSRELNKKFSRRTDVIMAEAARRGLTDAAEIDKLGALTRENKIKDVPLSELEPIWWARLSPEERQVLEGIKAVLERSRAKEAALQGREAPGSSKVLGTQKEFAASAKFPAKPSFAPCVNVDSGHGAGHEAGHGMERAIVDAEGRPVSINRATWPDENRKPAVTPPTDHDRRAVAFALEHIFERMSVVTENQLVGEAFKNWNYGQATLEGVRQVVRETPLIRCEREGRMFITTAEVLAEEDRLIDRCIYGKGKREAINPFWRIRDEELNREQKDAVAHVLNSRDFITGISGKPGVGKTRLLREIKQGIEGGCQKLLVLSPWAVTAQEVLRKEGFENAETVAKFLASEPMQKAARGAHLRFFNALR